MNNTYNGKLSTFRFVHSINCGLYGSIKVMTPIIGLAAVHTVKLWT